MIISVCPKFQWCVYVQHSLLFLSSDGELLVLWWCNMNSMNLIWPCDYMHLIFHCLSSQALINIFHIRGPQPRGWRWMVVCAYYKPGCTTEVSLNVMHWNHPKTTPLPPKKLPSTKVVPGAKNVEDHRSTWVLSVDIPVWTEFSFILFSFYLPKSLNPGWK